MYRRQFVVASAAAAASWAKAAPEPHQYHLRYAPRIGWLPQLSIPEQLDLYAEWGFRAFEYNGLPKHELAEIEQFRRKREDLGMAMGVLHVNSVGWTGDSLVEKKFHPSFLEDVRRGVEIWKVMGNEAATVTTGLTSKSLGREEQTRNCIEGLKRAAEIVEKTEMTLVLEPINSRQTGEDYFVVHSDHAREIVEAVNHPRVRILFDIYHQQISEGDLVRRINTHWDWIAYFQVGDVPGRKEPYTGEINYQNVFKAIHDKGFAGILGMEHGLAGEGRDGVRKCFEAYRRADSWDA